MTAKGRKMLISIQDSARVGETFRVFGISSEIVYNFKCLNAENNP